jgi:hypothetical protein
MINSGYLREPRPTYILQIQQIFDLIKKLTLIHIQYYD